MVSFVVALAIGIGVGVLSMTPPDFFIAKFCFIFSVLILTPKIIQWIVYASANRGQRMLISFLIFGFLGVMLVETISWVALRQKMTERPNPVPPAPVSAPFTTKDPVQTELFLFKDDPLFTESRKTRIYKNLSALRDYFIKLGFDLPYYRLPIGIGHHSTSIGLSRVGISTEYISLEGDEIDDASEATQSYAEYVVTRSVGTQYDQALGLTAESIAKSTITLDIATYFNWSFWGANKSTTKKWLAAFWDMHERFGAQFTDLLLTYTVKSFAEGSSPFGLHKFEDGKPVSLSNSYIQFAIYSHLEQAEMVVDNKAAKLPAIREILRANQLSIPDSNDP